MPLFLEHPELLQPFRRGETHALERVYWYFIDRVESVVRLTLSRSWMSAPISGWGRLQALRWGEPADVVQEIFLRAFAPQARNTYDGTRPFGPYLFAIARHLLVDWGRLAGREIATDAETIERALADDVPREEVLADARTVAMVDMFVRALPEDLRAVHHQRYEAGLSQRDAAAALGIGRQVLRRHEDEIRARLRHFLNERELRAHPKLGDPADGSTHAAVVAISCAEPAARKRP
jgi:RNA polymerase sigma-70 factor (ECF subfamily)